MSYNLLLHVVISRDNVDMIKINGRQFAKITGNIDRYCVRVSFVQDFRNVVNVVFGFIGPLSFNPTMFQSGRDM